MLATYGNEENEEEEGGTRVYAKKDSQLYGDDRHEKFVSSQFMKKYIHVARNIKVSFIKSYYSIKSLVFFVAYFSILCIIVTLTWNHKVMMRCDTIKQACPEM